ncbi:TPA: pyridoxal-phosphate dependent enzyme [Streptococcus pyogenes]|nr:pyridoxal-phosphate dependent enzyme [Streptococcus pyogenes]HER2937245.1 pyridoxal-phosphate dependent enzyme [Streptococcus pyogenes]
MTKIYKTITELVGQTPIIKLNRLIPNEAADVYVKLEAFNPGSSVKDRIALSMIEAAEAEESAVLSGQEPGPHKIQGISAGFIPNTLDTKAYDQIIRVKSKDALETARLTGAKEGFLVGISSGAALYAAIEVAKQLGKGKHVLTILPDNGERYLSTELYDVPVIKTK